MGIQQTCSDKTLAEFSQFSVVTGIINDTDIIFPKAPNEGHFLKAHPADLRPSTMPSYVCVKGVWKKRTSGKTK